MARSKLDRIRTELDLFRVSLQKQRSKQGPRDDKDKTIDIIERHLQKYGDSLWGHAIALPSEAGGGLRLVDRTNNIEESLFGHMKHDERRRSGRKDLAQDFEGLPAAFALATNLRHPDYVAILCGTLDDLPRAFAELETRNRIAGASGGQDSNVLQQDIASASLPREDRGIVRSELLQAAILSAAQSRAPRAGLLAQ